MKRIIFFLNLFIVLLCFQGCDSINLGVDNLLTAPKLSADQENIYKALVEVTGDKIELEYPRTGDNRSAFVIDNFDNEPGYEAMVFYKKIDNSNKTDATIRMNILDKIDGKWEDVFDNVEAAQEIDKVVVTKFGKESAVNILVGLSTDPENEKILKIFRYENFSLTEVNQKSYSEFEIMDTNLDNLNELITISNNKDDDPVVKISGYKDKKFFLKNSVSLTGDVVSYQNIKKAMVDSDIPAIYIDCIRADNKLVTEVITFKDDKILSSMSESGVRETSRQDGYYSMDMDNDDTVEIPVTEPYKGYEAQKSQLDIIFATYWYSVDGNCNLKLKYKSYYNPSYSYVFVIPKRWENFVTVVRDVITNEIVFYPIDEIVKNEKNELFRIMVSKYQNRQEYVDKGYTCIGSKGQIDYLIKSGYGDKQLLLTDAEIKDNFYIL